MYCPRGEQKDRSVSLSRARLCERIPSRQAFVLGIHSRFHIMSRLTNDTVRQTMTRMDDRERRAD